MNSMPLESKIAQVRALCRTPAQQKTRSCASSWLSPKNDKNRLAERMDAASARLEQLAGQLPEAKPPPERPCPDAQRSQFSRHHPARQGVPRRLPAEEHAALLARRAYVDGKMRDIAEKTKSNISERIAVMAALNIAHEHLSIRKHCRQIHQKIEWGRIGLDIGALGVEFHMEAKLEAVLKQE
jgi:cell division protein ZapA